MHLIKQTFRYFFAVNIAVFLICSDTSCKKERKDNNTFSVAFLTDIHLQPKRDAVKGLSQALDTVNKLNPDFIITGGDLILDALAQSFGRVDSLNNLYKEVIKKAKMPVYNTMGNHDIYGINLEKSKADPDNPEYGEKMFEKRYGKSYYSIEHKGWKFLIINSIEVENSKNDPYTGKIDSTQIAWIISELQKTDRSTPIVLSTHIPFMTVFTQKYWGSTFANDSELVIYNSKEVLDLFKGYNLKLVLQGHLHIVEEIIIDGVHFITGGAVSSGWWKGPNRGFEEGFVYLTFKGNDFRWRYVDYGWQAKK